MPTLWREVELYQWPYWLSIYPETGSKRALSFVRDMTLCLYNEPNENYPTKDGFEDLFDYVTGCLRMLKDTRSIDVLNLFVGLYDSRNYPSECNDVIEAINRTILEIVKRISKMKLRQLDFHSLRDTTRIVDLMSIIGERNVDKLHIHTSPIAEWAHRLEHFKKIKTLDASRVTPRDLEAETAFWTAVSQIPILTIRADTIPIPPRLDLHFPHVTDLRLYLALDLVPGDWSNSVVAVFKHMPGLQKLTLSLAFLEEWSLNEGRAMQVTTVACTKLTDLYISRPIPRGLVSTIAKHCPYLTHIHCSEEEMIDHEDLRQLSRSCPKLQHIRLRQAKNITNLQYLAALSELEVLDLFYLPGKFIDKVLLLNLVHACPKLQQIKVSDWTRPPAIAREFEDAPAEELFAAAAELPSYFVPKINKGEQWSSDGLVEYAVRLDMLREDMSQFQQLTKRFGMALVRAFLGKY